MTLLNHYTDLYSKCLVNLCERALKRMKDDVSSILFISSPGCNITQTVSQGYDMPGKIIFQSLSIKILIFDIFFQGFGKSAGEFAIRYYAKNLEPRGINANTIIPGAVNTEAWNGYLKKLGPKLGMIFLSPLIIALPNHVSTICNFLIFSQRFENQRRAFGSNMQKNWPEKDLGPS